MQGLRDVGVPEPDDDAGRGERAEHPDHQAPHHGRVPDELPALPDGLGGGRHGDIAAAAPLADLAQEVDGDRGDEVGRAVEVERQVHIVGLEDRRDMAEPRGDQRQDGEDPGRERRGAVGHELAQLVGALQLVLGHEVRDGGRGRRIPELDATPARNLATKIQVRFGKSGMERNSTPRTTSPTIMVIRRSSRSATAPATGPSSSAGSSATSHTPPTAELGDVAAVGQRRRQHGQRQDGQPVAQAGQRQRDPQPAERLDRQHSIPGTSASGPAA